LRWYAEEEQEEEEEVYKLTEISQHFFVKLFENIFHENLLTSSLVLTCVQKELLKNFPKNLKEIWAFWEATISSLVIWHYVRFQKNICFDFVMREHQIGENILDNVQLEKDRTYGKSEKVCSLPQKLKNEEKKK
jgi:hypothetical protein